VEVEGGVFCPLAVFADFVSVGDGAFVSVVAVGDYQFLVCEGVS